MAKAKGLKFTKTKGGPGSGHHGHAGRPGQIGGSVAGGWRAVPVETPLTPAQRRAVDREVADLNKRLAAAMPKKGWITVGDLAKQTSHGITEVASQMSLWELEGRIESRYDSARGTYEYQWAK